MIALTKSSIMEEIFAGYRFHKCGLNLHCVMTLVCFCYNRCDFGIPEMGGWLVFMVNTWVKFNRPQHLEFLGKLSFGEMYLC